MLSISNNDVFHDEDACEDDSEIMSMMCSGKEWSYGMRRCMQEVVNGVFLGPYAAATKNQLPDLEENQITHIVCVRQDVEATFIKPNFPEKFRYLVLNIADKVTENILQHFQMVNAFVNDCLNTNGRVLIHGNAGVSRSAALMIAYVMDKYNLNRNNAYKIVQQKRFCINPNRGFMEQLREYEPIFRARKASAQAFNSHAHSHKRTLLMADPDCFNNGQEAMDS